MNNELQNPITTPDWRAERLAATKRLYPDLFTDEGKINPTEIEALVADGNISLGEKFEFRWPGKMQAKKNAFTSSKARLAPDMDRSVNFDETKNVIIEGENLEVLKLLSKAYYNKVKCIYIDPPYNTGHDFVYSDDYSEGKQAYWEKNGVFHDGLKVDTNSESAGRYHTNWLNMMMPRLLLAQMMLKDDGVIFVSIDDNEVHNLRKLMDEIFGMENFVGCITWSKKRKGSFLSDEFVSLTEYCVIYAKFRPVKLFGGRPDETESQPIVKRTNSKKLLKFRANIVHTKLDDGIYAAGQYGTGSNIVELRTSIEVRNGMIVDSFELEGPFIWTQVMLDSELSKEGAKVVINTMNFQPRVFRIYEETAAKGLTSLVIGTEISGTNEDGYEEVKELFGQEKLFDYPKPINYIKKLISAATHWDDAAIILDFFAGSGTTAHAALELNKEDGNKRRFVLVQLPEVTDEAGEANKVGYKKISDITIERVKRAGERIHAEKPNVDVGFKVFKLTTSIFPENTYQPDPEKSAEENVQELKEHIARAKQQLMFDPKGKETDLMYETLIKQGFMLTMTKDRLKEFGENVVWKAMDGDRSAIVCLDADLKDSTVKALAKYKDSRFIGLHRAVDTTKKWELIQTFGEALVLI